MNWKQLGRLRTAEAEQVLELLRELKPAPARLVEIGGGSGWQARFFTDAGYDVASFDVATSGYASQRVFPVATYDGRSLPAAAHSADIVFSSNVLEHIPHVVAFQSELLRVLKPDGIALHILPTGTWRLWSNIVHYPWVARQIAGRLTASGPSEAHLGSPAAMPHSRAGPAAAPTTAQRIKAALIPRRHGEFGNAVTEIYYFSRYRWTRLFEATGWTVTHYSTNGLAYTGHSFVGERLSLGTRRNLARFAGSSCHVFVLRPGRAAARQPRR